MSELTSYPKEKIKILFLENISDKAVQHFKQNGYINVKKIGGALSEEELIKMNPELKDGIKAGQEIGLKEKVKFGTLCTTGGVVNLYKALQMAEKMSKWFFREVCAG